MWELLKNLLARLRDLLGYYYGNRENQERLYAHAFAFIGIDASPEDHAQDELGCADSVSEILNTVMSFPRTVSTATLAATLADDSRFFKSRSNPGRGAIIISPTGSGNGKIHGHVGIMADDNSVMAARSSDGLWTKFYTVETWKKYYGGVGGMPTIFFAVL